MLNLTLYVYSLANMHHIYKTMEDEQITATIKEELLTVQSFPSIMQNCPRDYCPQEATILGSSYILEKTDEVPPATFKPSDIAHYLTCTSSFFTPVQFPKSTFRALLYGLWQ